MTTFRLGAPTAAFLALALVPTGLAACGSDSTTIGSSGNAPERIRAFGSELTGKQAQRAEAAVRGYLTARAAGRWRVACSKLARPTRRLLTIAAKRFERVDGHTCPEALESLTQQPLAAELDDPSALSFDSVRAEGARGYVLITATDGDEMAMRISEEGSRWKVASINAIDFDGSTA